MRPDDPARTARDVEFLRSELGADADEAAELAHILVHCETAAEVIAILGDPEHVSETSAETWATDGYHGIAPEHRWARQLSWWSRWPSVEFFVHEHFDGRISFSMAARHETSDGRVPCPPERDLR